MGDTVIVEHYPQLDFSRSESQSSTMLSSVKSVRIGQHVTVKAKVTNMSKEEKAGNFTLVNCTLLDPAASVRMVLWENFSNQVENNHTYTFHNVTVQKVKYHDNIYLNTAKYGTEIKLIGDFTEVLAVPLTQDTTQFVPTTIEGEILGITTINSHFSFFKCNKKLEQSIAATYLECNNCHLKQKHFLRSIISRYLPNKKCLMPTTTEEMLLDSLFNLLTVKFTYNTTSKAVRKIAKNM